VNAEQFYFRTLYYKVAMVNGLMTCYVKMSTCANVPFLLEVNCVDLLPYACKGFCFFITLSTVIFGTTPGSYECHCNFAFSIWFP
jgi:hypothetical protein